MVDLEELRKRIKEIEQSSADDCSSHVSAHSRQSSEDKCSSSISTYFSQSSADECSSHVSAFSRIIKLCSYRERSTADMRKRLLDEEFDEEEVDAAIQKAARLRFLDDQRFAEALIHTRMHSSKGLAGCAAELRKHGIDPDSVSCYQELLCNFNGNEELERALAVLNRTHIRAKNVRDAAYRKLVNKGFGSDIAARAARIYTENT